MNYKTYSSEGFVLSRKNYSEADRIVVLFTKDFGKVSFIAKGVRKLKSRKRGGIEVFNHIKFSAVKGKGLDILTEVSVINPYEEIRSDLRKISVAYYFSEVIGRVIRDDERHSELFNIFNDYFIRLGTSRNLKQLRLDFVRDVLVILGFWPEGENMINPDLILEGVTERKINSTRVGKKMLT